MRKPNWRLNNDDRVVNSILKALERCEGECPCSNPGETKESRMCPCESYRLHDKCCCKLYVKEDLCK